MNVKVLIQTLTQIPDEELLSELTETVRKQQRLMVPDLRRLYQMFNTLYSVNYKGKPQTMQLLPKVLELNNIVLSMLLVPEVEIFWKTCGHTLIALLGEEDELIRQQARTMIRKFLVSSGNFYIIMQSLFESGISLESQPSLSVVIYSIKLLGRLLEQYSSNVLLTNSVQTIELMRKIFEEMLRMSKRPHFQLSKTSKEFLIRVFHMKIERIEDVLQRLGEPYSDQLQKLWQCEQEVVLREREENEQSRSIPNQFIEIKYEHLPLINEKILGYFEPFVFKQIFHPDTPSTFKYALSQLKEVFFEKEERLLPYINAIYKVVMLVISRAGKPVNNNLTIPYCLEALEILERILQVAGVGKLVQLEHCSRILCEQLHTDNVLYRKALRCNLKKLNFLMPRQSLALYEESLQQQNQSWLKAYEVLLLIQHWIESLSEGQPPTLSKILQIVINKKMTRKINVKIEEKCDALLILILEKHPGYREDLEEIIDDDAIGHIEDLLENRKNGTKIPRVNQTGQKSEQIFMKEYREARNRYLNQTHSRRS